MPGTINVLLLRFYTWKRHPIKRQQNVIYINAYFPIIIQMLIARVYTIVKNANDFSYKAINRI